MDHRGAVFGSALLRHHGNQLKGAADGPVWVWPGGGAVALHLQHKVVLQEKKFVVCSRGLRLMLAWLMLAWLMLAYPGGLQQVAVDLQQVLGGQTDVLLALPAHRKQLVANWSAFLGPKIHFLFLLTTNQQSCSASRGHLGYRRALAVSCPPRCSVLLAVTPRWRCCGPTPSSKSPSWFQAKDFG